ncbi:MAG: GNAT family N-acetyltransferase [Coriobacteriia bacterium]|nr:GNAT family N-acetyltransferase [Coriobacteriia bacterium]
MTDAESQPRTPFSVRFAVRSEARLLAAIVRESFQTEAAVFGDIPPLHESAADIEATFDAGDVTLVAEMQGVPVGTVRGETVEGGTLMVRRLAVLEESRGRGIARALMTALEDAYPDVPRFELFTGMRNGAALSLYESLGYVREGTVEIAPGVELVTLSKRGRAARSCR